MRRADRSPSSLDDLQNDFPQVDVAAVCQCSGNRRGLSQPHVAGVEWGYGAMGCATWRGPRLKDVLAKVGVTAGRGGGVAERCRWSRAADDAGLHEGIADGQGDGGRGDHRDDR